MSEPKDIAEELREWHEVLFRGDQSKPDEIRLRAALEITSLRAELAEAVTLMRIACRDIDRIPCDQADVERIAAFIALHGTKGDK